jgi:hypothetical protein
MLKLAVELGYDVACATYYAKHTQRWWYVIREIDSYWTWQLALVLGGSTILIMEPYWDHFSLSVSVGFLPNELPPFFLYASAGNPYGMMIE